MNVRELLNAKAEAALEAAGCQPGTAAIVGPATRPEFGDYQANGALGAAKRMKTNPRELAQRAVDAMALHGIATCSVTGPGFISFTLADTFLGKVLAEDTGIERTGTGQRIVIDYSHPNLAKEMHVGHLRSTIIGDALARTLEALGYEVVRQNHVGDWGTGFGMLVAHLRDIEQEGGGHDDEQLADLERFYQEARRRFADDTAFAERARDVVTRLQQGDPAVRDIWRRYIDISMSHCQEVYDLLGVSLRPEHVRGESAYNDDLETVVNELDTAGLITEDDGALCVFLEEFRGRDGKVTPIIVRKSDGAFLYHSTDLAAVRYRVGELDAKRVLYVVDARQGLHFRQLFAVCRAVGYERDTSLEHHAVGLMQGPGGRPFATRHGNVLRLTDLLDEAVQRARHIVADKSPHLTAAEQEDVARVVGIGAVKYADLSKNRTSDYVFDWEAMLSFDGNTAPYLQYAYARIQSLFRRGGVDPEPLTGSPTVDTPEEHVLALTLARRQETLEQVAAQAMPHFLCAWLYDLASAFMRFYENCPVLEEGPARNSRLLLCRSTADGIRTGLSLLGIETVERM
ncbi:MAG: arginine--tRNA ligase [Gammaproteobacteria bacterium]|nr:arginine--tRNA ligase [Gammaproteobacteria bacterium]